MSEEPSSASTDPGTTPAGGSNLKLVLAAVAACITTASLGVGGFFLWRNLAGPPPPPPAPTTPPAEAVAGPWESYELTADARAAQETANAAAPADAPLIAGNKVPADVAARAAEPTAPLVKMKFPGHGGEGQPAQAVLRLPTAKVVADVARELKETHGLELRILQGWESRGDWAALAEKAPTLTAVPWTFSYMVDAVDISRLDATGKKPLTLGTDNKVIYLEDLETDAGKQRFGEVVKKIEAEAIKTTPAAAEPIIKSWLDTAKVDFELGTWGAHDVAMEVFRKHGWTVGHCGEHPGRAWHAEPTRTMTTCERFSETWIDRLVDHRASPSPTEEYVARARALAMAGTYEPYIMDEEERAVNAAVNLGLPDDFAYISFNRVSTKVAGKVEDPDALIVYLALPGTDRSGKPQKVLGRMATVEIVSRVAGEIRDTLGLGIRANFLWRNNARQQQLRDATPKLAAKPGSSNHFVDAADISREEANGKSALTLGVDGKPIFLADLKDKAGQERFREVIRKIEADTLRKAKPKQQKKIVDAWLASAQEDFKNGVWGMTDVTMEVWRKHGWTTGHCGEITYESWHTEPINKMKKCERFDDTYNKRIRAYRKKPPPPEDEVFTLVEATLAKPLPKAADLKAAAKKARKCGVGCQLGDLAGSAMKALKKVKLGF